MQHYKPDVVTDMEMSSLDPQAQAELYLRELRALVTYEMGVHDEDEQWVASKRKKASMIADKLLQVLGENDIDYGSLGRADDIG